MHKSTPQALPFRNSYRIYLRLLFRMHKSTPQALPFRNSYRIFLHLLFRMSRSTFQPARVLFFRNWGRIFRYLQFRTSIARYSDPSQIRCWYLPEALFGLLPMQNPFCRSSYLRPSFPSSSASYRTQYRFLPLRRFRRRSLLRTDRVLLQKTLQHRRQFHLYDCILLRA